jgi:hypothetical protein
MRGPGPLLLAACALATDPACRLQKEVGRCRAFIERFYFDAETGTCLPFDWGGCGEEGNRWTDQAECKAACTEERAVRAGLVPGGQSRTVIGTVVDVNQMETSLQDFEEGWGDWAHQEMELVDTSKTSDGKVSSCPHPPPPPR